MNFDVEALAAHLATTDLDALELRGPDLVLRLVRRGAEIVQEEILEEPNIEPVVVRAKDLGIFLRRHPLHDERSAAEGHDVAKATTLGFLRVGPLLTAIRSPVSGHIVGVLAEDGALTGFNDPLFEIEPDGSDA